MTQWAELFPEGRTIFYEGDDPEGFRQQIIAEFGFDPAERPGRPLLPEEGQHPHPTWDQYHGWQFHCPPEHLDAIYGGTRWPILGS